MLIQISDKRGRDDNGKKIEMTRLIYIKKIRDNFRVYLECAHPALLTTLVVLVFKVLHDVMWSFEGCCDLIHDVRS